MNTIPTKQYIIDHYHEKFTIKQFDNTFKGKDLTFTLRAVENTIGIMEMIRDGKVYAYYTQSGDSPFGGIQTRYVIYVREF